MTKNEYLSRLEEIDDEARKRKYTVLVMYINSNLTVYKVGDIIREATDHGLYGIIKRIHYYHGSGQVVPCVLYMCDRVTKKLKKYSRHEGFLVYNHQVELIKEANND